MVLWFGYVNGLSRDWCVSCVMLMLFLNWCVVIFVWCCMSLVDDWLSGGGVVVVDI